MPPIFQTTKYHGAVVPEALADALRKKPIGKALLRFEKRGELTVMQARLLTDRINEVRGTRPGDKNYVDLNGLMPKQPKAAEAEAERRGPDAHKVYG